ncbi:uncharacterized protein LOC131643835 [Vicia villosa]|uniref:uncharacterized protein LOC131643835 n=1 Tax=Vicia villosa TaxID=3911 RepID=UPI00273AF6B4|nr:uncharacterized protein LOC131643835 [Vicia villosa]
MEDLEQENHELRDEVTTLRAGVERLTALVETLMAAQSTQAQTGEQTAAMSEILTTTISMAQNTGHSFHQTTNGFPWGMSHGFTPEGYQHTSGAIQTTATMNGTHFVPGATQAIPTMVFTPPIPGAARFTPVMTMTPTLVHTVPQTEEAIYHADPGEGNGVHGDFQDQFQEMRKEIKALKGKNSFGKNAYDMCLVPNVRIPAKFKVPDFEKYKGNSCPQSHLTMYCRKMATHTDDDKLLIHYFQDSLTGAALRWYMGLDSSHISSFDDLVEAFIRQYKYNVDMAPDRDQLRAMAQKERESFKEYAQRWREVAAQISPPMEEKEMTKVFLKTLSSFYYERMVASAPTDFTEMVNMGMRLEEGVREGRLAKEGSSSGAKKFGGGFFKKKEQEVSAVSYGAPGRKNNYRSQHVAAVSNTTPTVSAYQPQFLQQNVQLQPQQQTRPPHNNQQNRAQRKTEFDPIPMTYTELLPALIKKNLVQTRVPPPVPENIPWWYKADDFCAFHQGAPGHSTERCYPLKLEVQKLVKSGMLTFKDVNPNVQANPLPQHGAASVNMVHGCPGRYQVFDIRYIRGSLVRMHAGLCRLAYFQHDHAACTICSRNSRGCLVVRRDLQRLLDQRLITITYDRNEDNDVNVVAPHFNIPKPMEMIYDSQNSAVSPLVIYPSGPIPYTSDKAIPYKYNATMLEEGREVPIPDVPSVDNIAGMSRVTRSGRVFAPSSQKRVEIPVSEQVPVRNPMVDYEPSFVEGQSSGTNAGTSDDEILKLIKKSEYKVVDQLLQTPSKISVLSLLACSPVHREALMKILDQAFVDHDVTTDQFGEIVGNITAYNNLSFSDEDLPREGRNHNLALHISMNCKSDALSNVLVDTGSSLNVMPKSTLSRLSYQGAPMRYSGVIVKAFDGSRKSVIGEVDLPMKIGPHTFQIKFQVMDIHAAYSCLLGRPWIHEAGAVTSTLHQKLKFVSNGKLVTVDGEQALVVSHLSSFSYIDAGEAVGTQFQALSVVGKDVEKNGTSISSLKDARQVVQDGSAVGWGQVLSPPDNKFREGLGFSPTSARYSKQDTVTRPMQEIFHSGGFDHPTPPEVDAVIENDSEEDSSSFVVRGVACQNWSVVDVPSVVHISK